MLDIIQNEAEQGNELSVGEHFGDSDNNWVSFKVIMDKDSSEIKRLGKDDFNIVRRDLANVDWKRRRRSFYILVKKEFGAKVKVKGKDKNSIESWIRKGRGFNEGRKGIL